MTDRETYFIRAGRRDDITGVDMLLSRSYPRLLKADYPPSVLVTAVPLISRAQPDLVTCGTYYVAEEGETGRILAAGGWTLRNPATGRSQGRIGNIRHFATDPDCTRRGIAGRLMTRCFLDASDAGLQGLDCFSTFTAVPFYRAQGFREVGEMEVPLGEGISFPAMRMYRPL